MEILERFDGGVIALVNLAALHDHEQIKEVYLEELTQKIKQDNLLQVPIIVDKYSMVVLDGHHRFYALRALGCTRISAFVVDYYNPAIKVETWHPVVKTEREVKAVFKALAHTDFTVEEVASKEAAEVLVESEQRCMGFIVKNKVEEYYVVNCPRGTVFKDAMDVVRNGIRTEGLRKDMDYVADDAELVHALASRNAYMAILVPKVTKARVVESGTTGMPLPPKTTRHIIPGKRTYPVSLDTLKKSDPKSVPNSSHSRASKS